MSEDELMRLALALEQKSEHPLARAIMQRGEELGMKALSFSLSEREYCGGWFISCGARRFAT